MIHLANQNLPIILMHFGELKIRESKFAIHFEPWAFNFEILFFFVEAFFTNLFLVLNTFIAKDVLWVDYLLLFLTFVEILRNQAHSGTRPIFIKEYF